LIRALEAEQELDEEENESDRRSSEAPQPLSAGMVVEPRSRIDALRGASSHLDEAANYLEEQDLFERADEIRALADKLRRDARAAVAAAAPERMRSDHASKPSELRHLGPTRNDVEIELSDDIEQLREELRRVRQALETRLNQPRQ
ncbi:MAG TPA: hypothetical protein VND64_29960, partial [Pirellulales bacterium]|nr:hypothetical protein [Pirellulales bacterium]